MSPPRRTPAEQRLLVAALFAVMLGAVAITVALGTVLGAGFGEPCVQGVFSCRNAGFNDARCLMTSDSAGYCSRLCSSDADCPRGTRCRPAQWKTSGSAYVRRGRIEEVCLREGG